MVTFISLFLGLILGEHPIQLGVDDNVAAIELRLDGESIATLRGEPWRLRYDFGDHLLPHKLVAIALDSDGAEVARAQQWINMPRPPAEAGMVLESDPASGRKLARLTWESLRGEDPIEISASLDGEPLPVADPKAIPLPEFDSEQLHFFRAELHFPQQVTSTVEATFGGTFADAINSQLTAVLVRIPRRKPPRVEDLAGKVLVQGEPVEVVATERGTAEAVFLFDITADKALRKIAGQAQRASGPQWRGPLKKDQQVRMIRTFQVRDEDEVGHFDLFQASEPVGSKQGGVLYFLSNLRFRANGTEVQRLADVVAAAGTSAAANHARRHVVLVLGDGGKDSSVITPQAARDYLEALQVPFTVWSIATKPRESAEGTLDWGQVVEISNLVQFESAVHDLVQELDHQAIVWVAGKHLPQHLSLARGVRKVHLLR